jgi:hypothetical protein
MRQGMDGQAQDSSPLHAELLALAAPHLPVLVHKRARMLEGVHGHTDWLVELDHFATRSLWPHVSSVCPHDVRTKKRVLEILDAIVRSEESRAAAASEANPPYTSRFDTSWAI